MSLNLSCGSKTTKDGNQIIIQDNSIVSHINGEKNCSINIKDMFWNCNTVSCYNVSVPKNEYVEIKFKEVFGDTSNGKFIAIKTENSFVSEKSLENSNLYIQFAGSDNLPLGKLFVVSGTDSNKINATFKIYNGTPNANVSNITGGTYDSTVSVMVGY